MADKNYMPSKDPSAIEPYFFVWCDETGTNVAGDDGELQGATISSSTLTVPAGITKTTDNKNAVTIDGVSYAINTVVTVWLSGGTIGNEYKIRCVIVTSDSRTLAKTMVIPVEAH